MSMAQYEIRIVKHNGAQSLIYACEHLTDACAVISAEKIARESADTLEIWDGMRCVYRQAGVARTG
jgi:hypothetical protein